MARLGFSLAAFCNPCEIVRLGTKQSNYEGVWEDTDIGQQTSARGAPHLHRLRPTTVAAHSLNTSSCQDRQPDIFYIGQAGAHLQSLAQTINLGGTQRMG